MRGGAGVRIWLAAGLSVAVHTVIAVAALLHPAGAAPGPRTHDSTLQLAAQLTVAGPAGAPAAPATRASRAVPADTPSRKTTSGNAAAATDAVVYFRTSELDRRPFPLKRIDVPAPTATAATAGSVLIRLRISARGRVDEAKIVMGTGVAEFERAALRAFSTARFKPGYRKEMAVPTEMLIEVSLHPPEGRALKPQLAGSGVTNSDGKKK